MERYIFTEYASLDFWPYGRLAIWKSGHWTDTRHTLALTSASVSFSLAVPPNSKIAISWPHSICLSYFGRRTGYYEVCPFQTTRSFSASSCFEHCSPRRRRLLLIADLFCDAVAPFSIYDFVKYRSRYVYGAQRM